MFGMWKNVKNFVEYVCVSIQNTKYKGSRGKMWHLMSLIAISILFLWILTDMVPRS